MLSMLPLKDFITTVKSFEQVVYVLMGFHFPVNIHSNTTAVTSRTSEHQMDFARQSLNQNVSQLSRSPGAGQTIMKH